MQSKSSQKLKTQNKNEIVRNLNIRYNIYNIYIRYATVSCKLEGDNRTHHKRKTRKIFTHQAKPETNET